MTGSIRDAIVAANDVFMEAYRQGDAAALAALYTADGQLMPPNSEFVNGQLAIQGFWQAVMDMGVKEAVIETGEVEDHGNTAIEVSKFMLKGDSGQILDQGKFIVVWKQENGSWKLHRDIFNSSLPASSD